VKMELWGSITTDERLYRLPQYMAGICSFIFRRYLELKQSNNKAKYTEHPDKGLDFVGMLGMGLAGVIWRLRS